MTETPSDNPSGPEPRRQPGRHRRKNYDSGAVTGSFIPGDLTGEYTGKFFLENIRNAENSAQAPHRNNEFDAEQGTGGNPIGEQPPQVPPERFITEQFLSPPPEPQPRSYLPPSKKSPQERSRATDFSTSYPGPPAPIPTRPQQASFKQPPAEPPSFHEDETHVIDRVPVSQPREYPPGPDNSPWQPDIERDDFATPASRFTPFEPSQAENPDTLAAADSFASAESQYFNPSPDPAAENNPLLTETGRHRALKSSKKRGVAAWPLVVAVIGIVVVLSVISWYFIQHKVSERNLHDASVCSETRQTQVSVSAELTKPLTNVLNAYNDSRPKQGSICYHFNLTTSFPQYNTLIKPRLTEQQGKIAPQIWIPQSKLYTSYLKYRNPKLAMSDPVSLGRSPVVLAVQSTEAANLKGITWADLPQAQEPQGLSSFGVSSWLSLKLAMPQGNNWVGPLLTASAAVAATESAQKPQLDTGLLSENKLTDQANEALQKLLGDAPALRPGITPGQALDLLAHQNPDKTNDLHAVAVTEQQLFEYIKAHPNAPITEIVPQKFSVVADYPAVAIGGSPEDTEALNSFISYLSKDQTFKKNIENNGLRPAQSDSLIDSVPDNLKKALPDQSAMSFSPLKDTVFPSTTIEGRVISLIFAKRYQHTAH